MFCARAPSLAEPAHSFYFLPTHALPPSFSPKKDIVWEKLADVSGDNAFCNSNFSVYAPKSTASKAPQSPSKSGVGGASKDSISLEEVQKVRKPLRIRARACVPAACVRRAGLGFRV